MSHETNWVNRLVTYSRIITDSAKKHIEQSQVKCVQEGLSVATTCLPIEVLGIYVEVAGNWGSLSEKG